MIHRMIHRIAAIGVLGMLLGLTSCVTIGREFPQAAVDLIKPGVTTQDEVLKIFGNPMRVGTEDGKLSWTFLIYHATLLGDFDGHDLIVKFGPDNRVASFSFNTTDTAKKVKTN